MLNIHIKGKIENESQLIRGRELPPNAVQFQEGETIYSAFRLGFVLILPIILPMIFFSYVRCSKMDKELIFDSSFVVAVIVSIILGQVLAYLHEFIHAILYPREAEKTIWKDEKHGAYFVYCDVEITKTRFVILCIAPSIILGIIPFFVWYMIAPFLQTVWTCCIMILTWIMTIMSMGDFANIFNAIKQVPNNARIFNYGMHSYWIGKTDELGKM